MSDNCDHDFEYDWKDGVRRCQWCPYQERLITRTVYGMAIELPLDPCEERGAIYWGGIDEWRGYRTPASSPGLKLNRRAHVST